MSRRELTENLDELMTDVPPELGPILKVIGDIFDKKWKSNHALHLDKEERQARGAKPLESVSDLDLKILTHDRVISFHRANPNKPSVSIPVGQSDKITTATMPHEWLLSIFIQAVISTFDGDTTYAWNIINRMNEWIDNASETNEEGRLKINQDRLPPPVNAVDIAEMIQTLKRTFTTKSHGSTQINVSMTIDKQEETPALREIDPQSFIADPQPYHDETPATDDSMRSSSQFLEDLVLPVPSKASGEGDEGRGVPSSSTVEEQRQILSMAIRKAIGVEAMTVGQIGKAMGDVEKNVWKARLDAMVKTGEVIKEGERRSCRYSLCEVEAEV
jgi:hypothetical protein